MSKRNKEITTQIDHPDTVGQVEANDQLKAILGKVIFSPAFNAAAITQAYQGNILDRDVDIIASVNALKENMRRIHDGDLSNLESMLIGQATALQTIFTSLVRRAQDQPYQKHLEAFLTLGLKAQAQSRATIQTLAELKYPRQVAFVKQANISHGPQQVNNGMVGDNQATQGSREEKFVHPSNELLEAQHGEWLDPGAASTASGNDSYVEAVGTSNRSTHGRRKST